MKSSCSVWLNWIHLGKVNSPWIIVPLTVVPQKIYPLGNCTTSNSHVGHLSFRKLPSRLLHGQLPPEKFFQLLFTLHFWIKIFGNFFYQSAELILPCLVKLECLENFSTLTLPHPRSYLFYNTSEFLNFFLLVISLV